MSRRCVRMLLKLSFLRSERQTRGPVGGQLTSLSLHGNNITDVGATAIASVLGASNVKSLALTSNNMTNEGAWAVLDALEGAEVDEDEDEDE